MEYQEIESYRGGSEIRIYERQALEQQARMAVALVERWGAFAAVPDGEDSAGRQKLKLQDPKELAQRACAVVEALWNEFDEHGWILKLPLPKAPAKD